MLADPTFTINAVAQNLKRTGFGQRAGSFMTNDGTHRLAVNHRNVDGGVQHYIRLDRVQTVANPLTTGEFLEIPDAVWLVSKTPRSGLLTVVQQKHLVDGFLAGLSASSGALITQLLGEEA